MTLSAIAIAPRPDDLILIVAGQSHPSNSMNATVTTGTARAVKYCWADDTFYPCADPLPDGTGSGGSFLTLMGSQFSARAAPRPVGRLLIAPVLANGTSIGAWLPGQSPDLFQRVVDTYDAVIAKGWVAGQIVGNWVQGSSNVSEGTGPEDYADAWNTFLSGLRGAGVEMPIIVSRSTHCRSGDGAELDSFSLSAAVTKLKRQIALNDRLGALPNAEQGTYLGPNLDVIGSAGRYDYCHFAAWGGQLAAGLSLDCLLAGIGTFIPAPETRTGFALDLDSDYADNAVMTLRNVIPIEASGNSFRVCFRQNSGTGGRNLANASLVPQGSGAAGASAPIRVTFNGGQNGATLTNTGPLWSDWIAASVVAGPYLASWDQAAGQTMRARQSGSQGFGAYKATSQIAMQQGATGFTLISASATLGISDVQVQG